MIGIFVPLLEVKLIFSYNCRVRWNFSRIITKKNYRLFIKYLITIDFAESDDRFLKKSSKQEVGKITVKNYGKIL